MYISHTLILSNILVQYFPKLFLLGWFWWHLLNSTLNRTTRQAASSLFNRWDVKRNGKVGFLDAIASSSCCPCDVGDNFRFAIYTSNCCVSYSPYLLTYLLTTAPTWPTCLTYRHNLPTRPFHKYIGWRIYQTNLSDITIAVGQFRNTCNVFF